ncbi:putative cytokinetic ring protein SteA [Effusibacillus lacus]|uniref:Thiamin pyrophosphokinase n=1 Tax=Effusibacillus lacus TaxID=1348429 RepID=A0A292YSK8_9BACL|nr:putative cytokinetic ring protein SteA [Effusibacillus lacus]TCS76359.1 putative membrane-anchored protein [Effusibacillus lacus]GAX91901.1 thiamin pyrophosphokinase [Effusibacillus lacus]
MATVSKLQRTEPVRAAGYVRCDTKTKHLIPRLRPFEIAILAHEDLDEIAAKGLIEARVSAVVNTRCSMTGRYPNRGPLLLLQAGIPLLDMVENDIDDEVPSLLDVVQDGDFMTIIGGSLYVQDRYAGQGKMVTLEEIGQRMAIARMNSSTELHRFLDNTLQHAAREKDFFLGPLPVPDLKVRIQGRHALVVVRGSTYQEDLQTIAHYIKEQKPVVIGVDGGADALLQAGFHPDLIVGDMDSVTDKALTCGAELLVHAYTDGRAPGLKRVQSLGLKAHIYAAPGTSEDIAMLVAHEMGASLIVAVGTHTNMIDFLEKGRKGMASTLLTRLRVGPKLVDAKGVSQLYQTSMTWKSLAVVMVASLIPVAVLAAVNPVVRNILRILYLKLKLLFV